MKTVFPANRTPAGFENLQVTAIAAASPTPTIDDPQAMYITVEDQSIRYRADDIADPTTALGHLVTAGQNIWFENPSAIRSFRAIALTGTASLMITYYR